jgi:hypothetical protein
MIAFVCHLRLVWVAQLWGYGRELRFWCRAFGVRELNLGVQRNGFWCLCRWLNSCCRSIQRCLLFPIVEFTQHWVINSSCSQILGKLICMSTHARAWIYIREFISDLVMLCDLVSNKNNKNKFWYFLQKNFMSRKNGHNFCIRSQIKKFFIWKSIRTKSYIRFRLGIYSQKD